MTSVFLTILAGMMLPGRAFRAGQGTMRLFGLPVSGRVDGRFRAAVSAVKNPVPGAEKVWWRELRLEAVAADAHCV